MHKLPEKIQKIKKRKQPSEQDTGENNKNNKPDAKRRKKEKKYIYQATKQSTKFENFFKQPNNNKKSRRTSFGMSNVSLM